MPTVERTVELLVGELASRPAVYVFHEVTGYALASAVDPQTNRRYFGLSMELFDALESRLEAEKRPSTREQADLAYVDGRSFVVQLLTGDMRRRVELTPRRID